MSAGTNEAPAGDRPPPDYGSVFISGGAGFMGSHFARRLLGRPDLRRLVIFDNFSSGKEAYLRDLRGDRRLEVVIGDLKKKEAVVAAMRDCEVVIHLAANPDIAKAVEQPDIDFWEGTFLAQNVLEAMRINGVKRMLYTSGSGVLARTRRSTLRRPTGPAFRSPPMERASWPARRSFAPIATCSASPAGRFASPTSSGRVKRTAWATTSSAG